jgi:hypothetical protein
MSSNDPIEIADRASRKRAILYAALSVIFIVVQLMVHPLFPSGSPSPTRWQTNSWALTAVLMLLMMASGGGLMNTRKIRDLIHDDVSRANYRAALVAGYWVAMVVAMAVFFVPAFQTFTARQAVYLVVTFSITVAFVSFTWLELRAHRNE